jgi:ABC-type sugar transport system ATPase subunit
VNSGQEELDLKPVVVFKGIKKFFPGTKALDWGPEDVIEVYPGEIHGLVGENGAGKSTLFQVLMGFYNNGYNDGEITLFDKPYDPKGPRDAETAGISIIMQQPNFAYNMTVAENIFMGRDSIFLNFAKLIDWKKQNEAAARLLEKYHFDHIQPTDILSNLGFEERKQVEIVRALSFNPKVLLVDETSAAISKDSLNNLYALLRSLRDQGTAILYISHFIDEVYALCERVSVLRDGKLVAKMMVKDTTPDIIIKNMVGRDISGNSYRDDASTIGDVLLEVKNYSNGTYFEGIDLNVHSGEIVGIAGIGGCGSENFGKAVFGYEKITAGEMFYKGKKIKIDSPIKAVKNNIGFIPKDRDKEGLFLIYDLVLNISAANMLRMSKNNIVLHQMERQSAVESMKQFRIKAPSENYTINSLSGGNRQKVAIAKWAANDSDLLIVNAPARGVDVGAKYEIYRILEALKNEGKGILLISDELPELIGMCDRIYCFRKGRNVGEFSRKEGFTEEGLMAKMV